MLSATQLHFQGVDQTQELLAEIKERLEVLSTSGHRVKDCRLVMEPDRVFLDVRLQKARLSITRTVSVDVVTTVREVFAALNQALSDRVPWVGGYMLATSVTQA